MDQEKIGKFIANLRKERKITQQELADKLGVSEKTISNWENGRNMPDMSLYKPLCEEFGITINDLMSGEIVNKEEYQEKFEENVIGAIDNVELKNKYYIRLRYYLIILFSITVLIIIGIAIYNHVYFIQEYDKEKYFITTDENGYKIVAQDACLSDIEYIVTSFKNDKNNKIYFLNIKCTLWAINNNKNIEKNKIDLTGDHHYNFYGIGISDENINSIKFYYTKVNFDKIRNANDKELQKIIDESHLMEIKNLED